jgi:hypothetical protein
VKRVTQKLGLNSLMIVTVTHDVNFSMILTMNLVTLMKFDRIKLTMSQQLCSFTTKELSLQAD